MQYHLYSKKTFAELAKLSTNTLNEDIKLMLSDENIKSKWGIYKRKRFTKMSTKTDDSEYTSFGSSRIFAQGTRVVTLKNYLAEWINYIFLYIRKTCIL